MGVKLVSTSGGSVSIDAPVTLNNYVLTPPAASGTIVLETASQTLTNKTLTTPNINSAQIAAVSGTAPLYLCRAWVNFNGARNVTNTGASTNGAPVFIRASGNVTSVTKNSTGNYTVNFTTAMPDINYALTGSARRTSGSGTAIFTSPDNYTTEQTTSAVYVGSLLLGSTVSGVDSEFMSVAVFR